MRHTYLCPAKINWFLHITARRTDGYHELQSAFSQIDWADELTIEISKDKQIILTGDLSGTAVADNLIYRAAQLLRSHVQRDDLGAHLHIVKQIPTGAGLGGGSSNAATTLLALNQLWNLNLDNASLQTLGRQLGADVPFFVSQMPHALAQGIGEQLTPLTLRTRELLLVKPAAHADTRQVYAHPDLVRNHPPISLNHAQLAHSLNTLTASSPFDNDMTVAACDLAPQIGQALNAMRQTAPQSYVRMSGSGATVFALPYDFNQRIALDTWTKTLPKTWVYRWCRTLES